MQHEKIGTWKKCNMSKVQVENKATQKNKKVQHKESVVAVWNLEESTQEQCTIVYKQTTRCPRTVRYTMVRQPVSGLLKCLSLLNAFYLMREKV